MPRIEGYAIVSEDGMLANAAGIMPDSLKFAADRRFFESGLDGVDVVVHGRHSHERQPHSYLRRRLVLTRQVPGFPADPSNEKALFWNRAGASFEEALAVLGTPDGIVGVIWKRENAAWSLRRRPTSSTRQRASHQLSSGVPCAHGTSTVLKPARSAPS